MPSVPWVALRCPRTVLAVRSNADAHEESSEAGRPLPGRGVFVGGSRSRACLRHRSCGYPEGRSRTRDSRVVRPAGRSRCSTLRYSACS